VEGKLLMKDRNVLTVDESDIVKRATEFSNKIKQALKAQNKPVL